MRKKMALSVIAIALTMLLSFGVAVDQAKADSILFPWVVKSTAISTIVSVVNTAGMPLPLLNVPQLHLAYFYKDPNNNQTTTCQDYNFKVPTSEMDVVTFDASGNINGGLPMWGDPNNGPGSMALLAPGDRRAFLIVDNNTPALTFAATNIDGTLYGEAMVLELATGAAWGYQAYNAGGPFGNNNILASPVFGGGLPPAVAAQSNPLIPPYIAGQNGFVSFSNGFDTYGDVLGAFWAFVGAPVPPAPLPNPALVQGELAAVTLMPRGDVQTRMFLTPVDMISAAIAAAPLPGAPIQTQWANTGMRNGNINARVGVCAIPEVVGGNALVVPYVGNIGGILTGNCILPGIHTNDEAPISSTRLKNIVCTSADDISALLDDATVTAWDTSGSQAWTYMRTTMGNLLPNTSYQYSPSMMIGKLEWIDGGTVIDGRTIAGTFNNFLQVRSNLQTFVGLFPWGDNNLIPSPW
jgi:hypothetical protein